MISKQLDLPPYMCNPVGNGLSLFKSPVTRTNKANLEQEEPWSFQAPSAVLACVDSQQVTLRVCSWKEKMLHVSIPPWDLVERWVVIVIVLIKYRWTTPFADEVWRRAHAWLLFGTELGSLPWKEFCELSVFRQEKKQMTFRNSEEGAGCCFITSLVGVQGGKQASFFSWLKAVSR